MVHETQETLDLVFAALSSPARRAVLDALVNGPQPVHVLAEPHEMSLTGFMKHVKVLEAAGLIHRAKEGRVVSCQLVPHSPLIQATRWLAKREEMWGQRLDALGRHLYQKQQVGKGQKRRT